MVIIKVHHYTILINSNINITLNSKYACSPDGAEYSHANFLLVEIGCTKIVALNVGCCGRSTGERRMLVKSF